MDKGRRIAAAALTALALTGAGAAAAQQTQAQDPAGTVGNPQLKNFELPGRTTVPAPEAAPAPAPATTPPPATAQPQAEVPAPEAATPAPARPAPEAREVRRAPERETAAPEPAPAPAAPALPTPSQLEQALPAPVAEAPVPTPAPAAEAPAPVAKTGGQGFPWIYAGLALLLGLLAFAGYRKFRGSAAEVAEEIPAPQPAPAPPPQPAAAPRAAPAPEPVASPPPDGGLVGIQMRPWLELEFRPERAVATLTEASVQFELIIRNRGNAPARNIRIEARMFNAGPEQEQEIGAFYAEPIRERTPPSVPLIPPRDQVQFRTAVTMPKELVREVTVAGRRLFIPTVAFNVVYDWGANKSGQTSMSYVVGREAETPSEKMGAFRLDLGPRLYRSVGQRQTKLARIV